MTHSGIASFTRRKHERQHEMRNCTHADDLLPFMVTGVPSQCITLMERDFETKLEEYHKTSLEMGEALIRGSIAQRAMWMLVVVTRPQA